MKKGEREKRGVGVVAGALRTKKNPADHTVHKATCLHFDQGCTSLETKAECCDLEESRELHHSKTSAKEVKLVG